MAFAQFRNSTNIFLLCEFETKAHIHFQIKHKYKNKSNV